MKWIILGLIALSFAPVWRGSNHTRHDGMTLWQYLYEGTKTLEDGQFGHTHLPIQEAELRARQAFVERFQVLS